MESTRLRLRVVPGASKNAGIVGRYGEAWKIRVAAPPERGAANRAVLELLAETLGVSTAAVRLVSGRASRDKMVEVAGMGFAKIEALLSSAEREDA